MSFHIVYFIVSLQMMSPSDTNITHFPDKISLFPIHPPSPSTKKALFLDEFHPTPLPSTKDTLFLDGYAENGNSAEKGIIFHCGTGAPKYPYRYLSYAGRSIRPWPLKLNRSTSSLPSSFALRASRIVAAIACVDSGAGIIPSARANRIPALNVSS